MQKRSGQQSKRRGSSFRRRGNSSRKRSFGRKKINDISWMDSSNFIKKAVPKKVEEEYVSKNSIKGLPINHRLRDNILDKGFKSLTPIQDQTIPFVLEGKDVLGIANTGTGKTASFLIPLIEKVLKDRNEKILIVAPTRELAFQIMDEFKGFARSLNVQAVTCVGGAGIKGQMHSIKRKPNFVIGTPGRLKDLIDRKALNLSKFNNVVLDEVDRMLDMGFIHDIKYLISLLPKKRQSLFYSATTSKSTNLLIDQFLKNPKKVSVKKADTSDNVQQDIVKISPSADKVEVLHDLLIEKDLEKVLIFGRTKRAVDSLSRKLKDRGFKSDSIHGDKSQGKRQKALSNFKLNKIKILVATDVAARGLDIPGVTHVINYDLPSNYDDYVHRIGRTGRANNVGKALTFIAG